MMNTIMNLEYKLDLRYFLDRVLSFKRSLMLVSFHEKYYGNIFSGKIRENVAVLYLLAVNNFDFTRKIAEFFLKVENNAQTCV